MLLLKPIVEKDLKGNVTRIALIPRNNSTLKFDANTKTSNKSRYADMDNVPVNPAKECEFRAPEYVVRQVMKEWFMHHVMTRNEPVIIGGRSDEEMQAARYIHNILYSKRSIRHWGKLTCYTNESQEEVAATVVMETLS